MRIGVIVGVKDQAEFLPPLVAHLRRIGADGVLVADAGSTDGTVETVRALAEGPEKGHLAVMESGEIGDDTERSLDLAGPAFARLRALYDPDWIAVCDADEVMVPRGGSLKALLAGETHAVVSYPRFNAALAAPGPLGEEAFSLPGLLDVPLWTERRDLSERVLDGEPGARWVQHGVGPRVVFRASAQGRMIHGLHALEPADGASLPVRESGEMLCVHYPFTTWDRFARKVDNARRFFATAQGLEARPRVGWHWRRWIRLAEEGRLEAEFARQFVAEPERAALASRGAVRTVREILSQDG